MGAYKISSNEVYYQIFVGSFADSNGDGIGDFKGIIENLDYLNDGNGGGLGISGIWLTPIHLSDSFHKYDALDYKKVATQFGVLDDFKELVREAHQRNIKVILDLVFNCVSDSHPWFIEAVRNKESKYRDYFYFWDKYQNIDGYSEDNQWGNISVWNDITDDTGTVVDKYMGIYGKSMPDLNFYNKAVREECKEVASYWLGLGVDGFRLDSAMHLFSPYEAPGQDFHQLNVDWWTEFYEHCKSLKPDIYLVGEVWSDADIRARYMQGLKSDFHFFLGDAIGDVVTGKSTSLQFMQLLKEEYDTFRRYNGDDYINAPFLSNHDEPRYAGKGYTLAQLKMSASIYLTLEGLPFVYYGEELGLEGPRRDGVLADIHFDWPHGKNDIFIQNRAAFPWNNKYETRQICFSDGGNIPNVFMQMKDKESLYHHYKTLIDVRKRLKAFDQGRLSVSETKDGLIGYIIDNGKERIEVIHNVSNRSMSVVPHISCKYVFYVNQNRLFDFDEHIDLEKNQSCIFFNE